MKRLFNVTPDNFRQVYAEMVRDWRKAAYTPYHESLDMVVLGLSMAIEGATRASEHMEEWLTAQEDDPKEIDMPGWRDGAKDLWLHCDGMVYTLEMYLGLMLECDPMKHCLDQLGESTSDGEVMEKYRMAMQCLFENWEAAENTKPLAAMDPANAYSRR